MIVVSCVYRGYQGVGDNGGGERGGGKECRCRGERYH